MLPDLFSTTGSAPVSHPTTISGGLPKPITAADWASAMLLAAGINPITHPNSVIDLVGQIQLEHGSTTVTDNNPLYSTLKLPGSHSINSVGVQSYATWQDGIAANVQLMQQGIDAPMYKALQDNANGTAYGKALSLSDWEGLGGASLPANVSYGNSLANVINSLPKSAATLSAQYKNLDPTGLLGQIVGLGTLGALSTGSVGTGTLGDPGGLPGAVTSGLAKALGIPTIPWATVGGIALAVLIGLIGLYIMFHTQIDKGITTVVKTGAKAGEVAAV